MRSFSLNFPSPCASSRSMSCVSFTNTAAIFCDVNVRVPLLGVGCSGSRTAFAPPVAVKVLARFPVSKKSQSNWGAVIVFLSAFAFLTTGSTYNSALPVASAFSRSRPELCQLSFTLSAVRRLFAARGSLAFDLGADRVTTERPSVSISFNKLR